MKKFTGLNKVLLVLSWAGGLMLIMRTATTQCFEFWIQFKQKYVEMEI